MKTIFSCIFLLTTIINCVYTQNLFERHYGTTAYDEAFEFIEETNGDYVIVGRTNSSQGACIFKINAFGDSLWFNSYDIDTFANSRTKLYNILKVSDGYIANGWCNTGNPELWKYKNDIYLIKTDFDGNLVWSKIFEKELSEISRDMIISNDGNLNLLITVFESKLQLMKTDTLGNIIFIKDYPELGNKDARKIIKADKNNLVMLLSTYSEFMGSYHYIAWVVKTDSIGDVIWEKEFSGNRSRMDLTYEDGKYYLLINPITSIDSLGIPDTDSRIITLDSLGNTIDDWTYDWSDKDFASALYKTNSGFLVTGGINNAVDLIISEINNNGNELWSCIRKNTFGNDIQVNSDGNITICGITNRAGFSHDEDGDFYLFKTDYDCTVGFLEVVALNDLVKVFPVPITINSKIKFNNPSNKWATINIYNISGQKLKSFITNDNYLKLNPSDFTKGLYLFSIVIQDTSYTGKFIVQ